MYSNACQIGGILGNLSTFDVHLRCLRDIDELVQDSFLGVAQMAAPGGSWARRCLMIDMVALDMFLSACPMFKRRERRY